MNAASDKRSRTEFNAVLTHADLNASFLTCLAPNNVWCCSGSHTVAGTCKRSSLAR